MFGYVIPSKDKLSETSLKRYQAAYCGLCRSLKKRYGFFARFLVNYDMTFLYFLLSQGEQREPEPCFCPARVVCRKPCLPNDEPMTYAADLSVLLCYWKLLDAKQDGKGFRRLAARVALKLYRNPWRKAAAIRPEENDIFREQLTRLESLEQERCASIDRVADSFASLLRACARFCQEPIRRRVLEQLLYHVGRYLYLVDALEDLPKDILSGSYNPLCYRYALQDGQLTEGDKQQLLQTVDDSISMAASALELLSGSADTEIIRNIIYYGLPTVLHRVAEGSFRKKGKKQ